MYVFITLKIVLLNLTYSSNGGNYNFSATGSVFHMPNLEVERDVHWTHLTGLSPNTTYYFIAGMVYLRTCLHFVLLLIVIFTGPGYDEEGNEVWSEEYKFRTAAQDDSPYTFMVGGDMGNHSSVGTLTSIAAAQEPLFAVVGVCCLSGGK